MTIPLTEYTRLIGVYMTPLRGQLIVLAMILLGSAGLKLLTPQIMRYYLDATQTSLMFDTLIYAAVVYLGVNFLGQTLSVWMVYLSTDVGWRATNALRTDLARHGLDLDMTFHTTHLPGEMIERIDKDVNALAQFFSVFIVEVLWSLVMLAGILVMMYLEHAAIGLAFSGFSVAALFVMYRMRNLATPWLEKERQAQADYTGFLEERLGGMDDIRTSGAQGYILRRFFGLIRPMYRIGLKARIIGQGGWGGVDAVLMSGFIGAFAFSIYFFRTGVFTIGTVFLVTAYAGLLFIPLERLVNKIEMLQHVGAGITRINELLHRKSVIMTEGDQVLDRQALSVSCDRVSFRYGAGDLVLKDLSFELSPGRLLGVLGRTGSGKSTMTRLLFRLHDPVEGSIRLNDTDLRHLRKSTIPERIGMVTQEVQLFEASVRDNLTLFRRDVPDSRLIELIHDIGLTHWYASLEKGLDTPLSSGGSGLSAGEAQLLALVRVFLKEPGLVIMDEASSRLDPITEQHIEQAMDRLFENRTGMIIAHRLKTVQRVDDILILDEGRISEYGERTTLLKNPDSQYARLVRTGLGEILS